MPESTSSNTALLMFGYAAPAVQMSGIDSRIHGNDNHLLPCGLCEYLAHFAIHLNYRLSVPGMGMSTDTGKGAIGVG